MSVDLTVECGPHPQKRHSSDVATVARARVLRAPGIPGAVVELYGHVEQRLYRRGDGTDVWDEYVSPVDPDLARHAASERSRFDRRWKDGQSAADDSAYAAVIGEPFGALAGRSELAVRERAVLRCPVCGNSLPFADSEELRAVVGRVAGASGSAVSLDLLRRAQMMHKREQSGRMG